MNPVTQNAVIVNLNVTRVDGNGTPVSNVVGVSNRPAMKGYAPHFAHLRKLTTVPHNDGAGRSIRSIFHPPQGARHTAAKCSGKILGEQIETLDLDVFVEKKWTLLSQIDRLNDRAQPSAMAAFCQRFYRNCGNLPDAAAVAVRLFSIVKKRSPTQRIVLLDSMMRCTTERTLLSDQIVEHMLSPKRINVLQPGEWNGTFLIMARSLAAIAPKHIPTLTDVLPRILEKQSDKARCRTLGHMARQIAHCAAGSRLGVLDTNRVVNCLFDNVKLLTEHEKTAFLKALIAGLGASTQESRSLVECALSTMRSFSPELQAEIHFTIGQHLDCVPPEKLTQVLDALRPILGGMDEVVRKAYLIGMVPALRSLASELPQNDAEFARFLDFFFSSVASLPSRDQATVLLCVAKRPEVTCLGMEKALDRVVDAMSDLPAVSQKSIAIALARNLDEVPEAKIMGCVEKIEDEMPNIKHGLRYNLLFDMVPALHKASDINVVLLTESILRQTTYLCEISCKTDIYNELEDVLRNENDFPGPSIKRECNIKEAFRLVAIAQKEAAREKAAREEN